MAELIDIVNCITKKTGWEKITEDEKIKFFFIINRYLSKKYLDKAQLLNLKTIDKVSALDLWYNFMITESYPKWFWSKGEKGEKPTISEKDFNFLLIKLRIKKEDLDYLIDRHFDFIKEELKFHKDLEKR
jgi:hypothetical protein